MKILIKLYHLLNTLKSVAENIWIVDGDIVEMSAGAVLALRNWKKQKSSQKQIG